ncbi:MAG TPA: hypothetical protein VNO32_41875 [Candidatus Acidoferrum sp.]|nr:hypothetical protein [Candidatus Acidoferrum sp.]
MKRLLDGADYVWLADKLEVDVIFVNTRAFARTDLLSITHVADLFVSRRLIV